MSQPNHVQGIVVHDLPDNLASAVGKVITAFSRIEYNLSAIAALMLGLGKPEMNIALRMPRATDRLELILDLFALKAMTTDVDVTALRTALEGVAQKRDWLAHGLWLKHPDTGVLYLRLTRGTWPKDLSLGTRISRPIYPQSVEFSVSDVRALLSDCETVIAQIDLLGMNFDHARETWPDRFRPPVPVLNPLGHRQPTTPKQAPRRPLKPSRG